jgi:iron complex outermembrane recepter protein
VQPVVRNDIVTRDDDLISVGWNLKHTGAVWQTEFDAGYSKIDRTDRNLESWSGLGLRAQPFGATDTMTIQLRPGTHPIITPTIDYSNASLFRLTDPQGWGPSSLPCNGMYGYLKYFQAEDKLTQYKLSTKRELGGMFSEIEVGVSYTDRSKRDGEGPSGFLHAASASQPTPPVPALIGYTDMSFLGLGRIFAYDPLATYNAGILGYTENTDTGIVANRYQIDEELTRAFVQLGIDTKVGGLPLFGNIGLQVIHADQSSRGFSAAGNTLNAVRDSADYTDYAPSLNLNLVPAERTYVRFSAARQFARPRMFDMRASRTWSYNAANATQTSLQNSPWSGGGGNTRLRPWKANAFDVSFEKYFAENMGYFALTAFHKKLLNYIYQDNAVADFTGYPVLSGPEPALRQGIISTPVNGQGGSIKGLEFTLSLASELISPIKGFGVVLGGAYTDSSIKPWGPNSGDAPISGLARKVANATVYYENKGFSARVSQRYRSATREYVTNFGIPNPSGDVNPHGGFSIAQPESIMDAQVSYSVQNGRFKGLTLYIQGYNLTDEPLITYDNGDPRRVINHQQYGASYSAGVSFKF